MPGKINYSFAGVPRLEISRTMTVLTNATPNVPPLLPTLRFSWPGLPSAKPSGNPCPSPSPAMAAEISTWWFGE